MPDSVTLPASLGGSVVVLSADDVTPSMARLGIEARLVAKKRLLAGIKDLDAEDAASVRRDAAIVGDLEAVNVVLHALLLEKVPSLRGKTVSEVIDPLSKEAWRELAAAVRPRVAPVEGQAAPPPFASPKPTR